MGKIYIIFWGINYTDVKGGGGGDFLIYKTLLMFTMYNYN